MGYPRFYGAINIARFLSKVNTKLEVFSPFSFSHTPLTVYIITKYRSAFKGLFPLFVDFGMPNIYI